jgi:hypothetical protein
MKFGIILFGIAFLGLSSPVFCVENEMPDGLYFTGGIGGAFSAPSNLRIRQSGQDDINIFANYSNKSFEDYPYWTMRFENWSAGESLEFEIIHHKIYVENAPDDVDYWNVSDGYNMLMVNRAYQTPSRIWRVGAGFVIGHAENRVRGQELSTGRGFGNAGFYLGGPAIQAAMEWRRFHTKSMFYSFESKLTDRIRRLLLATCDAICFGYLISCLY